MKKALIIYGAGGLGREIKTLVDTLSEWYVHGFCDDYTDKGSTIMNVPVIGNLRDLLDQDTIRDIVIAIGDPVIKARIVNSIVQSSHFKFPVLIHPSAIIGDVSRVIIGKGSIITAGCVITTHVSIGDHVLINLNATVGHDTIIGNYSSVMPGANIAGNVTVGSQVLIGSGANVLNKITIGDQAIIGSGAVVTKNIKSGVTAVGVPARERKQMHNE